MNKVRTQITDKLFSVPLVYNIYIIIFSNGIFLNLRAKSTHILLNTLNVIYISVSMSVFLGKCHFLPRGGAPENWGGDQVLCLRSKGGSKDFSN